MAVFCLLDVILNECSHSNPPLSDESAVPVHMSFELLEYISTLTSWSYKLDLTAHLNAKS